MNLYYFLRPALAARVGMAYVLATAAGTPLAHATPVWPTIPIPADATPFPVGEQLVVNGTEMQIRGFTSRTKASEMNQTFRRTLGEPLALNRIGEKHVLGKAMGEFYVTVQLESVGAGTRGTIAVAKMTKSAAEVEASQQAESKLLAQLPPGSRLVSRTTSFDQGRRSEYLVLNNSHGTNLNREYVVNMFRSEGLTLDKAGAATTPVTFARGTEPGGQALFFKDTRTGATAMAVIYLDAKTGLTGLVLNTVGSPGARK